MRWHTLSFAFFTFLIGVAPTYSIPLQATPSPPVFAPKYMEQIPLRYADPAVVAKTLNKSALPEGVMRVQPDPKARRTLRVLGTQEGIATVRSVVSLIDVKPRKGIFKIVVERMNFSAGGRTSTATVSKKTLALTSNVPAGFKLTDSTGSTIVVSITARLPHSQDTPETLMADFGWREPKGSSVGLKRALPLPKVSTPRRVVGVTFVDNPEIVKTIGLGKTPGKWTGSFTAYYLAIQPVSISK